MVISFLSVIRSCGRQGSTPCGGFITITQRKRLYFSLFLLFVNHLYSNCLQCVKIGFYVVIVAVMGTLQTIPLLSSGSSTGERLETGKAFLIVPAYWQLVYLPRKTDYTRFSGSYSRKLKQATNKSIIVQKLKFGAKYDLVAVFSARLYLDNLTLPEYNSVKQSPYVLVPFDHVQSHNRISYRRTRSIYWAFLSCL